jgi:hypothetical protein
MKLVKELYSQLKHDKIELNWNKNPIPMSKFMSFLTVPTERSTDHLGYSNGWTLHFNEEHKLKVGGANYGGTEWLNRLEYGKNLSNPYNNYVNPFFLFDILTDEGKAFFVDYYQKEIQEILSSCESSIQSMKAQLAYKENLYDDLKVEVDRIAQYGKIDSVKIETKGGKP